MPKPSPTKKQTVAVVGAGIAGLSCAYELQKADFDVTIFEKEKNVGGRMATRTQKGFPFDIGANHLCNLYDEIKRYCEEFDIDFIPMEFVKYGLFKNGKVVPTEKALGLWSRLRLAWQMLRIGNVSQTFDFLNLSSAIDHDTKSAAAFIRRACGREVTDYIADPFASTYQFHRADEISEGALLALMESIKQQQPQWFLHHLNGEMSALPEALAERLNLKLGMPIESIKASPKGIEVTTNGKTKRFDAVVLATPASATRTYYQNPTDAQKKFLKRVRYSSTIGFAFRVPAKKIPDISVVWVPFVENQAISGYTNETMKGAPLTQNGETLICCWMHESFARPLLKKSNKALFAIAKTELLKVCPWFESPEELIPYDLQRWPEAMPKFYPGYLTQVHDFLRNDQGEQNVFLCGDYLNSPWTEGALRCGKRVAEQVQEKLKEARR